ncbi:hypothetical protein [Nostoc sp. MS1]|uniref:hypothetical protein n=1 Tax=Nostoc sp. MS1 TaxID=2764711 RepID=UPI001CC45956|nr:hypothetical protein [Nostoc sp. MS1]BCL38839.1 hypothetical protein NSMS1_52860 [Nostoc sp. MS1]
MEIDNEEPQNLDNSEVEEQLIVSEIITPFKAPPATHPLDNFMETYGAWDDERTTDEIIKDIYDNRTSSNSEYSL